MKSKRKYYVKYWLPPIIYCLLIFVQSMMDISTGWFRGFDKLLHFFAYALLGILIFRALTTVSRTLKVFPVILFSVGISTFIGVADEMFQIFEPSRTIDRVDILFDFAGSAAGILFFLLIRTICSRNRKSE